MPKVSIIVPVYNVEKYIRNCLDSIRNQTFTDWECILVDDGSTDKSGEICDEYVKKDWRFDVIHKQNKGVSSARNHGINLAKGEWIMFIDADDAIALNTLEVIVHRAAADNLDLLQFSYTRNKNELGQNDDSAISDVCNLDDYISYGKLIYSVWGNLIKTSIIRDNSIRFHEQMKLGEDQMFIYTCMTFANHIMRIPNILYYYFDNPNSATNNEKSDDIIFSSQQFISFKYEYPEFSCRIDNLVLYYIEKLLLRKEYKACLELVSGLKPRSYSTRPWPTRLLARSSYFNPKLAIALGAVCYPAYVKTKQVLSPVKHFILRN